VNLQGWPETMAYLMVFVSTMVEGEVVFVGASAMVSLGLLNPFWVFAAAAAGGSAGDQLFYYALRGRLRFRLERWAWFRKREESVRDFVLTNATLIILCSRFLPGLRIAIPAACAHAGVPPLRFSCLSMVSSALWSGAILLMVGHFGPASLSYFGVSAWWSPILIGCVVLLVSHLAGRRRQRGRRSGDLPQAPVL
jgi:membrane protein DedA with SNARE-associated domain